MTAFGVNAMVCDPGEAIDTAHDEADTGQHEIYIVVAGRAEFTLGSDTYAAGPGTIVAAPDPARAAQLPAARAGHARGLRRRGARGRRAGLRRMDRPGGLVDWADAGLPPCGEENPPRFRLCGFCGTPLREQAPVEVRKTVTVLFSDVAARPPSASGSTPSRCARCMGRYFDVMRAAIERHGGTVEKFIGDAVMAVFGLPQAHEDDALRAVRAALDMREALDALNAELERDYGVTMANRTGVNTGEVVTDETAGNQRLATGDAVNVAARLEQAAPAMETLLGALTHALVRDAVAAEPVEPLELKGKAERVPAFRLVGLRSAAAGAAPSPLVGRDDDLALLRARARARRRRRRRPRW